MLQRQLCQAVGIHLHGGDPLGVTRGGQVEQAAAGIGKDGGIHGDFQNGLAGQRTGECGIQCCHGGIAGIAADSVQRCLIQLAVSRHVKDDHSVAVS